jgi:FKBP-type peptidyl-prolyl cis-trans isomerase FkpA
MKIKILFASIAFATLFTACIKENDEPCKSYDSCAVKAPQTEIQQVRDYLVANNITDTVLHCSGVFYSILNAGTGKTPTPCSYINTNYVGKLTNGTIFDQGSFPQLYRLVGLIPGWINTLPLIRQGGSMRLYIPPSLGYGSQPRGNIPANSILIFDLQLTQVED